MATAVACWRQALALLLVTAAVSAQFENCFPDSAKLVTSPNSFNFTGIDAFGLRLFRELVPADINSNILVSPYSIWSALSLALFGAQGNTRLQLENALGLPNTKLQTFRTKYALNFLMQLTGSGAAGGPEIRSIDRAYFDRGLPLRQCVPNVIQNVEIVDFSNTAAATARINNDVSRGTGGQIKDFLNPSALVNAVFVLINAIYFKGNWQIKFKAQDTTNQVFYNHLGQNVATVEMMTQMGQFKIVKSPPLGATMLELPYAHSNISMLVFLPDPENPSVEGVLNNLNSYTLNQALKTSQNLSVKVYLPKFEMMTEVQNELLAALQTLGVTDMFNPVNANFEDFTASSPLFADTAVHQAKIAVDEEGTVAAAATAIIGTRSGPSRTFEFIANRPFVFLIYEKRTRITLFAGVMRNPQK